MPGVPGPVSGTIFGYFQVPATGNYNFLLTGTNIGAQLFINNKIVVDAYFTQTALSAPGIAYLNEGAMNRFSLNFFSTSDHTRSIEYWWRPEGQEFQPIYDLFFSQNTCYDGILDPQEAILTSPLYCYADVTAVASQPPILADPYCGDGVCQETDPNTCIQDCWAAVTFQCSPLAAPPGHIPQGFWVEDDTVGDLISNQVAAHLPGIEHVSFGVQIVSGEESLAPLFYFGYCSDIVSNIVQDVYRGSVYNLPAEVYAEPLPQCSYSTQTQTFSSASTLQTSMASSYGLDVSASASGGAVVKAEVDVALSLEESVSSARDLERQQSGSIVKTSVVCSVSKVELAQMPTFHPIFVQDVSQASTVDAMLNVVKKYGTHYYEIATLGGKLEQISVSSGDYEQSQSEQESSESATLAFSASVSAPVYGAASGSFDGSLDSSVSMDQQNMYQGNSSHSTVITHGGAPGAFSPTYENLAPTSFGDWAATVDLLPVPIDFTLGRIADILPTSWVVGANSTFAGYSVVDLWEQAELNYLTNVSADLNVGTPKTWYTLYWFYSSAAAQNANVGNIWLDLFDLNGNLIISAPVQDQQGPLGTEGPLWFQPCEPDNEGPCEGNDECDPCVAGQTPQSPVVFSLLAPRSQFGIATFHLYSTDTPTLHSSLQTTYAVLNDLSESTQYYFIPNDTAPVAPVYNHDSVSLQLAIYKESDESTSFTGGRNATVEVTVYGRGGQLQMVVNIDGTWPQQTNLQFVTHGVGLVPQFMSIVITIPKNSKYIGQITGIQLHQGLYQDIWEIENHNAGSDFSNPQWQIQDIWAVQTYCSELLTESDCSSVSEEGVSFVFGNLLQTYTMFTDAVYVPLYSMRNLDMSSSARLV